MAGPAVACHLQIIEIPGNGFQLTSVNSLTSSLLLPYSSHLRAIYEGRTNPSKEGRSSELMPAFFKCLWSQFFFKLLQDMFPRLSPIGCMYLLLSLLLLICLSY